MRGRPKQIVIHRRRARGVSPLFLRAKGGWGSSVIRIRRCALLQAEREQRVARADDDELAAVEQIRLRTIARVDAEAGVPQRFAVRSEEHTSELQSRGHLVCRLL